MNKLTCALLGLAAISFSGIALAKDMKNESANFKVDVPDNNWVQKARGEVLVLEHTDATMIIELIGHPDQDVTPRTEGFDTGRAAALLAKSLGDVKLTDGHVHLNSINGMQCIEYDGNAKDAKGRSTFFVATTCKTAPRKGVTAVMFATDEGFNRHKDTAAVVIKSIKPLRQ